MIVWLKFLGKAGTEQDIRALRRSTSQSTMTEELSKKHLQQQDNGNGTWQALKDVLDEAIDLSIGSALTDGIDNDDRNWRAGTRRQ